MLVELTRGPVVESVHHIEVAVVDSDGPMVIWGSGDRPIVARSALKFVQALPLLRTGAAERYSVTDDELILACSSHSAEAAHVDAVRAWLARLGLDETALECGADLPIGRQALIDHYRRGGRPTAILNCCSGKHTGFLTVARHLDVDPAGYIEPDHPVQRLVTAAVEELTGCTLADQSPGRDGCGIPTFGIPLVDLARSMARLVTAGVDGTGAEAHRLVSAAAGREFWLSGTGRHEVTLGRAATEALLVKAGAEGVFMAALPDRGVGIAIKASDGAARAAEFAVSAVLAELGAIEDKGLDRVITNKAGVEVGRVTVDLSQPTLDRR